MLDVATTNDTSVVFSGGPTDTPTPSLSPPIYREIERGRPGTAHGVFTAVAPPDAFVAPVGMPYVVARRGSIIAALLDKGDGRRSSSYYCLMASSSRLSGVAPPPEIEAADFACEMATTEVAAAAVSRSRGCRMP